MTSYTERFGQLTVPELKVETKKRGLSTTGKKKELLMRLSLWARDEIATVCPEANRKLSIQDRDENAKETGSDDASSDNGESSDDAGSDDACDDDDDHDDDDDDGGDDDDDDSSDTDGFSSDDELELCSDTDHRSSRMTTSLQSGHDLVVDDKKEEKTEAEECEKDEFAEEVPEDDLHHNLQKLFGFDSFRNGQEWACRRCLDGHRSLLIAPTGFGKSLCYALPAAMMDGVCLVISPLISLIEVRGIVVGAVSSANGACKKSRVVGIAMEDISVCIGTISSLHDFCRMNHNIRTNSVTYRHESPPPRYREVCRPRDLLQLLMTL